MKGAYIITMELKKDAEIVVGKLGSITFKKGIYYYAGSSQNNLEKRVERHKRKEKTKHWYIDYLTTNPEVKIINDKKYVGCLKEKECELAKELSKKCFGIKGFGCSDCRCSSHLFYSKNLLKDN